MAAGYQLKRGAAKPLLEVEMEPGQAIKFALDAVHPSQCQPSSPQVLRLPWPGWAALLT
jgi:hypothetical protein